ncbi:MAG: NAD-dependent epimerase/dehydratase family protein [Candidatus Hydrogenedentales bacterium]|jgi:CDP-paratose 2-epimerase
MFDRQTILITGGAGFVGAHLALVFKEHYPSARVIAFDNLKRKGSELNLPRLIQGGIEFLHGDVRVPADFPILKNLALIVECSAEPSVLAGYGEAPAYVIDSNLNGVIHCLELARNTGAAMLFLSTSRVYPIQALCDIALEERDTRFEVQQKQDQPGITTAGIDELFPINGARSLYGATKYAAEVFITEYAAMYGLHCIINRCGIIAGPWQMGRVDQGLMSYWLSRHIFKKSLSYIGFGGKGKQLRDMLHVADLRDLILLQAANIAEWSGSLFNVGGGVDNSISLQELTRLCTKVTGETLSVSSNETTRPADIPYYVSNNKSVQANCGWSPSRSLEIIAEDTARWMRDNCEMLRNTLG